MSMHLITGYAGSEHITSADQGAYNMGTYGEGEFVLNRGNKFVTTIVSNNSITVADGEAMMQGRYIKMIPGTSETVTIDNGTSGMKRNDLICLRYEKDSDTGIESVSMVVVKGTESSSTPEDPEYTQGTITDGTDLVNEMPLYRVYINGLNIDSVTQLFSVKVSMVDYMDSYQLPIATPNTLGGVKIGQNINVTANGSISISSANRTKKGVVQIGQGLKVINEVMGLGSTASSVNGYLPLIDTGLYVYYGKLMTAVVGYDTGFTYENAKNIMPTFIEFDTYENAQSQNHEKRLFNVLQWDVNSNFMYLKIMLIPTDDDIINIATIPNRLIKANTRASHIYYYGG